MGRITPEMIRDFIAEHNIEYKSTQAKLCVPIVDRIYQKMLARIRFSEIKIDSNLICDGHHRYLASMLADYPLNTISSVRTSATKIVDWKSVYLDNEDWDTPAKIRMLNEQDAEYNGIPVDKLAALLK